MWPHVHYKYTVSTEIHSESLNLKYNFSNQLDSFCWKKLIHPQDNNMHVLFFTCEQNS